MSVHVLVSNLKSHVCFRLLVKPFEYNEGSVFTLASFEGIDIGAGFVSMGLGFCMSLLFMIDQHECTGLTSIPDNKCAHAPARHLSRDVTRLLVVSD